MAKLDWILYKRRRERQLEPGTRNRVLINIGILALILISIAAVGSMGLFTYAEIMEDLPEVNQIEWFVGVPGVNEFSTSVIYDRTTDEMIAEIIHPYAISRNWWSDHAEIENRSPVGLARIVGIFAPDPAGNEGLSLTDLVALLRSPHVDRHPLSIPERLISTTLLPAPVGTADDLLYELRRRQLADELSRYYAPEQLQEWFLNNSSFGNLAYGVDAAALVYFGVHVDELTLAQMAFLVPLAFQPDLDPVQDIDPVRTQQRILLLRIREAGLISDTIYTHALTEKIELREGILEAVPVLVRQILEQTEWILDPGYLQQIGIRIISSIDLDIQRRLVCNAEVILGWEPESSVQQDEIGLAEACLSAAHAGGAAPIAITDAGSLSWIAMKVSTGEIISMGGDPHLNRSAGSMLDLLLYLNAFSKGFSPASMILDLPGLRAGETQVRLPDEAYEAFAGPVSMRTALVEGFSGARERVFQQVGSLEFAQTAQYMGVDLDLQQYRSANGNSIENIAVSLLDITHAYGILANEGRQTGFPVENSLNPTFIRRISDRLHEVYVYQPHSARVLSSQLNYLVLDSLRIPPQAIISALGSSGVTDQRAVFLAHGVDSSDMALIGLTPDIVLGVWWNEAALQSPRKIDSVQILAAFWRMFEQSLALEEETSGWLEPAGMVRMQVCDPSGLLPTRDCAHVVEALFLSGNEPIVYDQMYQTVYVDRETDRLATVYTPYENIEVRIYLNLPLEAQAWAEATGLEQAPTEYDTLSEIILPAGAQIQTPHAFSILRGIQQIRGDAFSADFDFYQLQFGLGLFPQEWTAIETAADQAVHFGYLATWDVSTLDGLITLQLIVVDKNGDYIRSQIPLRIDNVPPQIRFLYPSEGQVFDDSTVVIDLDVTDNLELARVDLFVDGRKVITLKEGTSGIRWTFEPGQNYRLSARAYDTAGNWIESETVNITIGEGE